MNCVASRLASIQVFIKAMLTDVPLSFQDGNPCSLDLVVDFPGQVWRLRVTRPSSSESRIRYHPHVRGDWFSIDLTPHDAAFQSLD